MTLTDFLLARFAEDEAVAQRLADKRAAQASRFLGPENFYDDAELDTYYDRDYRERMVRIGITRVLTTCEAKRRIVEMHAGPHQCVRQVTPGFIESAWSGEGDAPCQTLRALALPYVDRLDFRPEWVA